MVISINNSNGLLLFETDSRFLCAPTTSDTTEKRLLEIAHSEVFTQLPINTSANTLLIGSDA